MTIPNYNKERTIAELAALRAAILTKTVQESVKDKVDKDDKSPVTAADYAAQALLIAALSAVFPNDGFVGEEDTEELEKPQNGSLRQLVDKLVTNAANVNGPDGRELARPKNWADTLRLINMGGTGKGGSKGRFWVMDPVDGTKTFLKGQQYAVSLSLIEDGKEVVGVLCCPNLKLKDKRVYEDSVDSEGLGVMLTAVRGQGSTQRILAASPTTTPYVLPQATKLDPLDSPADMEKLHIVDSRDSAAIDHKVIEDLISQVGVKDPGTEVWSSHMRYASLILGGADCQVRVPAKQKKKVFIWDHAGAQLIFTEAGGKITDLNGKAIDFGAGREICNNDGMMIAREGVHQDLLAKVIDIIGR